MPKYYPPFNKANQGFGNLKGTFQTQQQSSCDSSFQSQQTQDAGREQNFKTDSQTLIFSNTELSRTLLSQESFYQANQTPNENTSYRQKSRQIVFPSILETYNQIIAEDFLKIKSSSALYNLQIKNLKRNIQTIQWKIMLVQKISNKRQKGNKYLANLKNLILNQKIPQKIERQILFFKCQCGNTYAYLKNFKNHIRKYLHKPLFQIDTKNQRKKQSKIYDQIGCQNRIENFQDQWIYRSFQVIFLQADIHYIHVQDRKNKQFLLEIIKIKDCNQESLEIDVKQVDKWFIDRWMKIYENLHQIYKGNQSICHKCLTIDQHLCLFTLGLSKLMTMNRKTFLIEIASNRLNKIMNFVKNHMKNQIQTIQSKRKSVQSLNSKTYLRIKSLLRMLAKRYLNTFDYIDYSYSQI